MTDEYHKAKPNTFMFDYKYNDRTWGEYFKATSMEEAQERVKAMRDTAVFVGQLDGWIPAGNEVCGMDDTFNEAKDILDS